MKKLFNFAISFVLMLAMALCITSCNKDSGPSVPDGKVQFNFTVELSNGDAVNGAMVVLCNEGMCNPYTTDTKGKVSVTVDDIAGWTAHVEFEDYTSTEWSYTQSSNKVVNYTFVITK